LPESHRHIDRTTIPTTIEIIEPIVVSKFIILLKLKM
jgi:hypothetical protein